MVPDNEIVVTKLENECNFISNFFVLMYFTGQKKKLNGVIHSVGTVGHIGTAGHIQSVSHHLTFSFGL